MAEKNKHDDEEVIAGTDPNNPLDFPGGPMVPQVPGLGGLGGSLLGGVLLLVALRDLRRRRVDGGH